MRIPEQIVEEVLARTDIVELVSEHVPLKKRGRNYFGFCPFHNEKTPSFSVNAEKQIYHCFGCGAGGNAFSFLMEIEKISFMEALETLAQKVGVVLPEKSHDAEEKSDTNDLLYKAVRFACDYYCDLLKNDSRAEISREYIRKRAITWELAEKFQLGWTLPDWDGLLKRAQAHSIPPGILEQSGLVVRREGGEGFYDRFRDRLVFPIFNSSGRPVAFGGRTLDDTKEPKYLNSSETPIYYKGRLLYGLNFAKEQIRKSGKVVLVEGYMDLLRLVQSGFENSVATAGTSLTIEQSRLLRRYAPKVIVLFDGDPAGVSAATRAIDVLTEADLVVEIVRLPEEHDPDSFVREEGPEALTRLLENPYSAFDYKLQIISRTEDLGTPEGKRTAVLSLVETASKMRDSIRQSLFLREISERLSIDENAVRSSMKGLVKSPRQTSKIDPGQGLTNILKTSSSAERELLKLMIIDPTAVEKVEQFLSPEGFKDNTCRRLAEVVFSFRGNGRPLDPALLISSVEDPALVKFVSELVSEGFDEAQLTEGIEDCILRIRIDFLSNRLKEIEEGIKEGQEKGENELLSQLLEDHRLVSQEREILRATKKTT